MDEELVEVYRGGGGGLRADFFSSVLRGEGISCLISSGGAIAAHPMTVGPMGEFRLLVAAEEEERARELIDSLVEAESSPARTVEDDEPEEGRRMMLDAKRPSSYSSRDRMAWAAVALVCAVGTFGSALAGTAWWIFLWVPGVVAFLAALPRPAGRPPEGEETE